MNKIYFILFLIFSCNNPLTNNEHQNCILDLNGFFDDCGICSGGITGIIPDSNQDCNGVCNGDSYFNECGQCVIENIPVCNDMQPCPEDYNCIDEECVIIKCIPDLYEEVCESQIYDCAGDCDGELVEDCVDTCGGDAIYDQCGVCNGINNFPCNSRLLTLENWKFSQIKLWNNDTCFGNPIYIMDNYICLEDNGPCFNYSITFSFDTNFGIFTFAQTLEFNNGSSTSLTGNWTLYGSSLCLDYTSEQYEDGCYDQIDFNYSYNDCASDLSLCEQNTISLTSRDLEQGICSKEILNTEEPIESLNQIPYSLYDNFPFHIRNIFSYINSPANIK